MHIGCIEQNAGSISMSHFAATLIRESKAVSVLVCSLAYCMTRNELTCAGYALTMMLVNARSLPSETCIIYNANSSLGHTDWYLAEVSVLRLDAAVLTCKSALISF